MKNILTWLLVSAAICAHAQLPFKDIDSISVNNVNAVVSLHGDMWYNYLASRAHCNLNGAVKKNISSAGAIWLSAYDGSGQLHVAAQTMRSGGIDFWPGPLEGSGSLSYAIAEKWAKIWKVSRAEVNMHKAVVFHNLSNTPESILSWPGRGNTYARGKGGVPLDVVTDMAPFVDNNGDGLYQPLSGEYPDFRGEEALWQVFSDNGPTHNRTNAVPLLVEVHAMTYAYKRGTLIDNVVYYEYTVLNKSANNYHDMRWALWAQSDVAYYLENHTCFDSVRRMMISYRPGAMPAGPSGTPENEYGKYPPAVGYTLVALPGDGTGGYEAAGSSISFYEDPSVKGVPAADTEFCHYMHSRFRNGSTIDQSGYYGLKYAYDLSLPDSVVSGWCGENNDLKNMVLSSNSFDLAAGAQKKVVMALVVRDSATFCPPDGLDDIDALADTAWGVYNHPLPSLGAATQHAMQGTMRIYPNPANDVLFVSGGATAAVLTICDLTGRELGSYMHEANSEMRIDIGNYAPGVYMVRSTDATGTAAILLLKQ